MTPAHVTRQTEPFVAACARAAETVVMLGNSHFHVLDVCIDLPRPTIRVRECETVRRMIERGDAVYYARSHEPGWGVMRGGQFQLNGCRVIWTESQRQVRP